MEVKMNPSCREGRSEEVGKERQGDTHDCVKRVERVTERQHEQGGGGGVVNKWLHYSHTTANVLTH